MKEMVKQVLESKVVWPWVKENDDQSEQRSEQLLSKGKCMFWLFLDITHGFLRPFHGSLMNVYTPRFCANVWTSILQGIFKVFRSVWYLSKG